MIAGGGGVDERALVAESCRFSSLVLGLVLAVAQSSQAGRAAETARILMSRRSRQVQIARIELFSSCALC